MHYWRNDLERRLDKALLTERQKQIANALLQFNGCAFQTRRELYEALFGDLSQGSALGTIIGWWNRMLLPKIAAGLALPNEEWTILLRLDPWWREFVKVMGRCKVHEVVARRERVMGSMITHHASSHRQRFDISIETRLRRCELSKTQELLANAVFELEGHPRDERWTIFELTRQVTLQDPEANTREVVNRRDQTKQVLAVVRKKVCAALELTAEERALLVRLVPWYKTLFTTYPRLSPSDVNWFVLRCFGQSGRPGNAGVDALTLWRWEVGRLPVCSDQDLAQPGYAWEARNGEPMRLFNRGLRHVAEAARAVYPKGLRYGFDYLDCIQESAIGWWLGWPEWEGGGAHEFKEFVSTVCRTACNGAFAHPTLKSVIAEQDHAQIRRFVRTVLEFRRLHGCEPSLPQLREMLGWTPEEFRRVQDATRLSWKTFISLSAPASKAEEGEGDARTKEEIIPSTAPNPEEALLAQQRQMAQQMVASFIEGAIEGVLTPTEQVILQLRFGFHPEHPDGLLLEEVAEELDVLPEEVVLVEDEAIIKLRSHPQLVARFETSMRILRQSVRVRPPPQSYGNTELASASSGNGEEKRHGLEVPRTLKDQLAEFLARRRDSDSGQRR